MVSTLQLDDLLSLKQQQAAVFQAWQSVQQADEAVRQGRSIMVFTFITIIFVSSLNLVTRPPPLPPHFPPPNIHILNLGLKLPLAFIASIFGMNNKQIAGSDSPMTLQSQFKLMCKCFCPEIRLGQPETVI